MARPLRLEFPGAIWHITTRGNEKREIYRDDIDRQRFLDFLARTVMTYRWILHAWVLMANHYHLLVETPQMGLSRGVKWLNQNYVELFNKRHDRVGHLFQGRFKAILVEREGHLLELVRYIVLNPVRCGAVVYASDYEWSNYAATAGLTPPPSWLEIDWTLAQFGAPDRVAAHEAYRQFVADARGASYNPWEKVLGQIYLGSAEFRDRMQKLIEEKQRSCEHPRPQRVAAPPSLQVIVSAVVGTIGQSPEELREKSREIGRKALAHVAVDHAGLPLREVAECLGVTSAAVTKMCVAARRLYESSEEYRSRIDRIRKALS